MTPRPIEIIGGGLTGLSLGIALRRAGLSVTIHEAGDYPRHRVCGEFIAGLNPATLGNLGVDDELRDALRHRDVAWSMGDQPPRIQRLPSPAFGMSRHVLDARLAARFRAAGGILMTRSRVEADEAPGRIFATGRRRAADPKWIGLKVHVRGLDLTRSLEMHLGEHCYVGLARVEQHIVNVCGLFRRRPLRAAGPDLLLSYLRAARLDRLADRVAAADVLEDSFCAVAALDFQGRVGREHRVCLGDASAMIPPFTGNGMAMAFQSAELALAPLLAYARADATWAATREAIQDALRNRFRVRLASAEALHPFLLRPRRQRWIATLGRARLLPLGPLYAALH